jgi:protein-L-isoaspartate(D-aspartate) O-methyltransferase
MLRALALSLLLGLACTRAEPQVTTAAPAEPVERAEPTRANGNEARAFGERRAEREALVAELRAQGIADPRVLAALRRVPRHAFVPEAVRAEAYQNRPLPIGNGQTISQPYIVGAMTEAANPKPSDKCLEIGTGSGYQAAVLAEVCGKVYSIEYLEPLAKFAEANLRRLGYGTERVALRHGDGYRGWPDAEPFDVVLVTAAPEHVPKPLLDGLAMGGRLVIPVGPERGVQHLELWTRRAPGSGKDAFEHRVLMGVRFVPFLGDGVKSERR